MVMQAPSGSFPTPPRAPKRPHRRYRAWAACVLLLCSAPPVLAQSGKPSPTAPAAQATTKDVFINGSITQKSAWKRADSDHVVVFCKCSADELRRVTNNLERLFSLMSRLYRHGESTDDTLKMQVTLIDSASRFRALGLRELRSQEGPFSTIFANQRYYNPRDDGEVLAVAQADQLIDLNTMRRFNLDCDDYLAHGGMELCGGHVPVHAPVVRSWEAVLYSGFAQHFILTYVPAAYPRWYLDGIGALFSTIDVQRDGAMDYARAPVGYQEVFHSYGYPDAGAILTGRYLDASQNKTSWSPYDAWLLAHYFLFSNLKPDRRRQFQQYMTAIHQGAPMAEAVKAFGDMRRLQREIVSHAETAVAFAHADAPKVPGEDPLITPLSVTRAALIEAKIELETRLAAPLADAPAPATNATGVDWLARLRNTVAQLPYDADALLLVAEAECRSGHYDECLATADRVLARSPDNVLALAWKGIALTDQAVAGPAADSGAILAIARRAIERGIALDSQAPLPQIAYFQSFTKAGERVPQPAMLGMAKVIQAVPAAPGPRLYLAQELLRQGDAGLARRLLYPVLYGSYDSPEKRLGEKLFSSAGGTSGGH